MKSLAVWSTLARHLRPAALVRDGVLLMAIGALAAFALLYAGRLPFDRTVFTTGLSYSAEQAGTHAGGLVWTTAQGYSVTASGNTDGYDARREATTVATYDAAETVGVRRLLGGLVRQGGVSADGVLVDEPAAVRMGVRPGDSVTLTRDDSEAVVTLRVTGVIAPFHQPEDYGNGGLVVGASALLGEVPPTASTTTYFPDGGPVGSRTKWQAVAASIEHDVTLGPLVLGLLAIGLALWCIGLARVASEVTAGLRTPLDLLVDLGTHPRIGRAFVVGLVGALALVAGVAAAFGARQLITTWTTFYVTSHQIFAVALTLAVAALLVARLVVAAPDPRSSR